MNWSRDTDFKVVLTRQAEMQAQRILDYIFYEPENAQAAYSVEKDIRETIERLSHVASSLKLCDAPELRSLGYRTIHLKQHKYFLLYKIAGRFVYVVGIYHDLQDYESAFE